MKKNNVLPQKKLLFRPARRVLVCQDMAAQLQTAILDGDLAPGERLPSETRLMRRFQTSRPTVRQALRLLEEKGLVEITDDGGIYVRRPERKHLVDHLDLLVRCDSVSLDQLAEFRQVVESRIASMAAQKADASDTRRLLYLAEQAGSCINQSGRRNSRFLEADKQVHLALAGITGNPIYSHLIAATHGIKSYFERFLLLDEKSMADNVNDLRLIAQAVGAHDARRASDLSVRHIRTFNQY